jgi:signal transduction histidine kinase
MASVDELIKKMLDVALPAKPEGIEVKLDLNCWDQRIRVNEIQISQLMLNLILNAFDAMGSRGTLRIHTTFDAETVWIRVADNGAGMPEDVRRHIFDPFFTTKDPGKGTGLGLAIAAQVVEDHKGNIRVESKEGSGTTFFVSLPRLRAPQEE